MKTKILYVLLTSFSLNCFSLNWFSKPQQAFQPKVVTIEFYDPINFKETASKLFHATKQSDIVGVIVTIDSDGGLVTDFSVLHDMVKKLALAKPVVCLVYGNAYSCGYMVASAANLILAHSCSGIGAIGAYTCFDRYSNAHIKNDKIEADLKEEVFRAGEFKDLGNPFLPELTERQRDFVQTHLKKTYDYFITVVAQNRNLKTEDYEIWAEGKNFIASEALELGLIDGIGTIFDAEEKVKELILARHPDFGPTNTIQFIY